MDKLNVYKDVSSSFESYFGVLNDPRVERSKLYPLSEILFVVLSGSICGAESWRDFVLFGKEKLDFMRQYYPFSQGIPSKNTFARVLAALDPDAFKRCFVEWVKSLQRRSQSMRWVRKKQLLNKSMIRAAIMC